MKRIIRYLLSMFIVLSLVLTAVLNSNIFATSTENEHTNALTDKIEYFTHDEAMSFLAFVYNVREVNNLSSADELIYKYMTGKLSKNSEDYLKAQLVFYYATLGIIEDNCGLASTKAELSGKKLISFLEQKVAGRDDATEIANDFLGEIKSSIKSILSIAVGEELNILLSGYNGFISILNVKDKVEGYYKELCAALNALDLTINRDMANCYKYFLRYYEHRSIVDLNDPATINYFELLLDGYALIETSELDAISIILGNLGLRTYNNDELRFLLRRFAEFSYHTASELNNQSIDVVSISIKQLPSRSMYAIGDEFDSSGMILLIEYSNGITKEISTGYNVSYDFSEPGIRTVTIEHGGSKVYLNYEVGYAYGWCGDNVYYYLTYQGELKIDGFGNMYDQSSIDAKYSYRKYLDKIKKVFIGVGVETIAPDTFMRCVNLSEVEFQTSVMNPINLNIIGDRAFFGCSKLMSINIPDSVTTIGGAAFYGCSSLTNIIIPNSVTYIGASTFSLCRSLTNITIPSKIPSLEDNTFSNCSSLKSITIPDSVTSIGKGVFSKCDNLATIKVDNNNKYYCDIDGVLFTKDKKILVTYPGGGAASYTIPDGVITISEGAFIGCNNLVDLTIADSVKNIGGQAFIECSNLTHVKIGDGVEDITAVFWGANVKTVELGRGIKNIGVEAFYGSCLTEIVIPEGVESIDYWAFAVSSLTSITIPDSVKTIDDDAFEDCYDLKNIYITSLESWFECCSFTNHPLRYGGRSGDGKLYINGVLATDIVIPNTVCEIAYGAFHNCGSIKSVSIPNSVTTIDSYAFYGCNSLTNVTIPNSVTKIGSSVFDNCYNLESIYIYRDSYAEKYCLADETLKTKLKYIPTEIEFMSFEGYQVRDMEYNGLRSRFIVDLTAMPTLEADGFEVIEYGTIFASTEKLTENGDDFTVFKNDSGVYDTLSYGKLIPVMKNGSFVGKYISKNSEQLIFACTVTNFSESNFDKEVSIRGYAVLSDADGNEYVVYCDYPSEDYRSVSLAMICDALAARGEITEENNISYAHVIQFRKEQETNDFGDNEIHYSDLFN